MKALQRNKDFTSAPFLKAVACILNSAASNSNAIENKWGGLFGMELFEDKVEWCVFEWQCGIESLQLLGQFCDYDDDDDDTDTDRWGVSMLDCCSLETKVSESNNA